MGLSSEWLRDGERCSRDEFERRYSLMPKNHWLDLIDGVVHVISTSRRLREGEATCDLVGWLGYYQAYTRGTHGGTFTSIRLDPNTETQPDSLLCIESDRGGQSEVDVDDFLAGAPELIAVAAVDSSSVALQMKWHAYERNGVREYLVWRLDVNELDWYVLRAGRFEKMIADERNIIRSEVFPGLWLDVAALLDQDDLAVHRVSKQGLATKEHAAFVAKLNK